MKQLKTFLIVLILLGMTGCVKKEEPVNGCDISEECSEPADMSGYEYYAESEDYVYVKSSVKDMAEMMDEGKSFVIYFGFARCPWCRDAMPVLNEAAKETGTDTVYYVDTRAKEEWKSNLDIDDYDLFVEKAGDYLTLDDNSIKHLYTPMVLFIKDGKIVETVSAPDYDAHEEAISDELREELKNTYLEAFAKVK